MTEKEQRLILGYVQQCPLFQELSEERLLWIVSRLRVRQVQREETVLGMGDPSDAMGLLLKGQLKAVAYSSSGREIGFSLIRATQHFGELSLIDGQPRSAAVLAVEASLVAFLPRKPALELMVNEPSVSARMMVGLTQLVRRCNQQIMLLGYQQAHSRVCALLLRSNYEETPEGFKVLDFPSQREVASLTNTSRETVSRVLSQLHESGVINKKGRIVWIMDLPKLEKRVLEGRD
ncbi:CRP/FNR family cyclic AMP-dependent transcriptional regulator [Marinobacterium halophilum]|uniref:CRP/FNR family cyclic AMP-dependent transcriptional regulator n=1 Tax=Marinobacterium halophilum TaxID=267374 RepID=A0A2P8EXA5_9GAMM|nr:Crp/Fnr family transcriptional regulator [Marinobacterium halophilum]PSL14100.1 CRP/FNR family cyclic AMP-dependent transcriptional regulator [Marinobacterium halophilum]